MILDSSIIHFKMKFNVVKLETKGSKTTFVKKILEVKLHFCYSNSKLSFGRRYFVIHT